MRHMIFLMAALLAFLAANSQVYAFEFTAVPSKTVGPEISAVPDWAQAKVEKGDTLSSFCGPFLADMKMTGVTQQDCWLTIANVNGFKSMKDLNLLRVGQEIWLPAPTNTAAVIAARLTERRAVAALAANPLGMASELRKLMVGDDSVTKRLADLETAQLDAAAVEKMVETALAAGSYVSMAQFDLVRKDLMERIAAGTGTGGGLTVTVVSTMIAEAFTKAGLPDAAALEAVDTALAGLTSRVTALETAVSGKADTTVVAAVDGRVTALEQSGVSQQGLWLALAALVVALAALLYGFFFTPSKRSVRKIDTKIGEVLKSQTATNAEVAAVKQALTVAQAAVAEVATTAHKALETAAAAEVATAKVADRVQTNVDTVNQLIASQFNLTPKRSFPTQAEIDALQVGENTLLTFEFEGRHHNLMIVRDDKGLHIEGLTGRTKVVVVSDSKAVIATVLRAFAKALSEKKTAEAAFKAVTPVKLVPAARPAPADPQTAKSA